MKRLTALVGALFIFICFSSCSAGTTGGVQTAKNAASAGDAALSLSSAAGESGENPPDTASAPRSTKTIAIRVHLTPAEEDAMQMLAEEFNASNDQGIRVDIQNGFLPEAEHPEDGTEPVAQEDNEDLREGAPDETDGDAALLLDDVNAVRTRKGLQSLNERFAAEYGNDPDVPQSLRGSCEVGGEIFGVPFDLDGDVFYYNASLYDDRELEIPETWEDLLQAGELLMEEEGCPVMATDSLTDLADLLLRMKGSALTDGRHAGFSGTAGDETFSFLMSLLDDDCLLLTDKGTCRDQFLSERCAGYIGKGSDLADMFRNSPFAIGAVPVPHPEGETAFCAPCTMRVLALYPGEKDVQDAAWAFVRYLTTPSVSARWAVATGHFPVRGAAYLEPEYESYMETSVAAGASTAARYGYYLEESYSEDLQYRVREIIGRNIRSNVTGAEITRVLSEEINDSLMEN